MAAKTANSEFGTERYNWTSCILKSDGNRLMMDPEEEQG
jgi:hypothetical protein